MPEMIICNHISKIYKTGEVEVRALSDVSLEIGEGEFIVVLGPSGSGKSTLLNILGGMDSATSGEFLYRGTAMQGASERQLTKYRRNAVGFVFQFYNLMPNLTVYENVRLATEIVENPFNVKEMISKVGLDEKIDNFPSQLSGGQQQRVAIARAVAKNPEILLCDEPTGALDFASGIQVMRVLVDINKDFKKTVIVITHNAAIGQIADRIFYIKDGRIDRIVVNEHPIEPEEVSW